MRLSDSIHAVVAKSFFRRPGHMPGPCSGPPRRAGASRLHRAESAANPDIAHRYLLGQLIRREVLARYRGSALGIGWSFLHPLLLLFAFTLGVRRRFRRSLGRQRGWRRPASTWHCSSTADSRFSYRLQRSSAARRRCCWPTSTSCARWCSHWKPCRWPRISPPLHPRCRPCHAAGGRGHAGRTHPRHGTAGPADCCFPPGC
jgi:hypothetical protein